MANTSQAPDLEDIHRGMHGIAKQIRIINEINACLSCHSTSRDIQLRPVHGGRQVCTPNAGGVMSCWSLSHLAKLKTRRDKRLRDARDHLAEMTELTSVAISLLPKRLRTWMLGSKPSIPVQMPPLLKDRSHGPPGLVQELDDALESKANKYIATEEFVETKCRRRGKDDHKRKEPNSRRTDYRGELKTQVLMEIKNEDFVKWLEKIKTNPLRRNKNKYSQFHKDHGHNTEEANGQAEEEVYNLSMPKTEAFHPITFTNEDLRGLHLPHVDALVISSTIANFNVQRILINNGSSTDILFISEFDKIRIGQDRLHPFHTL
ncbi:TRNA (guanine(9)-N1)-methyltransferase [Actinidia chinensis var. chinensis]|uniref:tRNA (Guanine(9)-N1)-methyltransferase n=1 Tax=Actinidia chinensis var. chinensis TaxID=1590841 RepID=A0A2R6S1D6_ACTCC|nr:TRNA (guanine(9)-N1)-methyltransferase [Actinidia chinensis var. chinensis]